MARVLLVDDEKNIRNGLRAIISRTDCVFTEIDECSNGADALRMLSESRYDLLITDLIMPQMDGLKLVEEIDCMEHKPLIVILSGFDDFKYAQKAINYGVKAYLLKPVDRNELISILKKAEAEILARQSKSAGQAAGIPGEFFENRLSLLLLSENLTEDKINRIFNADEPGLSVRDYYLAVLNSSEVYQYEDKRANNSILNIYLKKCFEELGVKSYSFLDHKGNAVAVVSKSLDIKELMDSFERLYGFKYAAGLARCGTTFYDMRRSYDNADYALRYRVLKPSARILDFADIPEADAKYVIPVRLLKNLAGMLDTDRREDLCRLLYQIFDENEIRKHRLEYLDKLSAAFRDEIIKYLSEYMPNKVDYIQELEDSLKYVCEFSDIQEYIYYICSYAISINNILLKMKNTYNTDDEIDQALVYIRENYGKDLTMAEVANRISLNYSYFSLLFKGKTGMNFVDYLKTIRIEKAKELLKNTDYKIYEISEMVGYNNTKHFSTMFREFTGISPKEFREKIYLN